MMFEEPIATSNKLYNIIELYLSLNEYEIWMNCFLKTAPMNHFDLFFFGLAVLVLALDIGLEKDKSHLLLSDEDMLAL